MLVLGWYTTLMIRTKLTKLHLSPISLYSASSVRIPSSVNNFWDMLSTIRLSPLGSSIFRKYTKLFNAFKRYGRYPNDLSAMPRGVSVAHIYVLKLPLHHLFVLSYVCYVFVRVCLYVLCGHLLGKGWPLGSYLWSLLWVCHFDIGILGQVWYLIVSIPDLCTLTYFELTLTSFRPK